MKLFKTPTSVGFEDIRNRFHCLRAFTESVGVTQIGKSRNAFEKMAV